MQYAVRLTRRALRDLDGIYEYIQVVKSLRAADWFNGLEKAIISLERYPHRCPGVPEDKALRHLLYGRKPHVYRIIHQIDERSRSVTVLHIRHGSRAKAPIK